MSLQIPTATAAEDYFIHKQVPWSMDDGTHGQVPWLTDNDLPRGEHQSDMLRESHPSVYRLRLLSDNPLAERIYLLRDFWSHIYWPNIQSDLSSLVEFYQPRDVRTFSRSIPRFEDDYFSTQFKAQSPQRVDPFLQNVLQPPAETRSVGTVTDHPAITEFRRGTSEGRMPTEQIVAVARRLCDLASRSRQPEISVDMDGALSFDLRLHDDTLVMAELAIAGTVEAGLYNRDNEEIGRIDNSSDLMRVLDRS